MNNAQRKVLIAACFVFSPVFILIGIIQVSALTGVIIPIAFIFAGFYIKNSQPKVSTFTNKTYEAYADKFLPIFKQTFIASMEDEIKEGEPTKQEIKLFQEFMLSNFDTDSIKQEYIDFIKRTYTIEELNFMWSNISSEIGVSVVMKSNRFSKELEEIIKPEITRVIDLMDEKNIL